MRCIIVLLKCRPEDWANPPVSVLNPKSSILQSQAPTTWYRLKHLQDYKINTLQGLVEENENSKTLPGFRIFPTLLK
jgi:hypothetical protein